jgi:ferredoxin
MSGAAPVRRRLVDAFSVHLHRTGRTIRVRSDQTVLDALLGAGVPVESMCRNGLCGTCQTRVLSGDIDHRDSFLTDEQHATNQYMIVCVSGSVGGAGIVLDL